MEGKIGEQLEVQLCEFCNSIDFESLAAETDSTRASRHERRRQLADSNNGSSSGPDISLGSLADIIGRAVSCSLCSIIALAVNSGNLSDYYPDFAVVNCGIGLETYARSRTESQIPLNVSFDRFNVIFTDSLRRDGYFPRTELSLQACTNPIPSVEESCKVSSSAYFSLSDIQDPANKVTSRVLIPSGRLIKPYTNHGLFRDWISLCVEAHGQTCSQPKWLTPGDLQRNLLRVVDVNYLCIVEASPDCNYLALSYVWGPQSGHIRLLTTNTLFLQIFGVLGSLNLPKTIMDAIMLVRGLGYRYLWVDSLCIMQDDDSDKALQILYMDSIYATAVATIIDAHGSHADVGLAGQSYPRRLRQACAKVSKRLSVMQNIHLLTGSYFPGCAWNKRGWTMQERLCSRRVITLAADQAFWHCERADWCESMALESVSCQAPGFKITTENVLGCYGYFAEDQKKFDPGNVYPVIEQYCERNLSYQSDALNAIEGYFRRVSATHKLATFLWGHLAFMRFDESLAWSGENLKRRKAEHTLIDASGKPYKVPFPSWSWLGWKCQPFYFPDSAEMPEYELEFFRIGIYGRVIPLLPDFLWSECYTVRDTSRLKFADAVPIWKGNTSIKTDKSTSQPPFVDSGKLLFWTSKADLTLRIEPGDLELDPKGEYSRRYFIMDENSAEVGELISRTFPEDTFPGGDWPEETDDLGFAFIVVSRVYIKDQLVALPVLNVLMVRWDDEEKHIASRLAVGTVDEDAWVRAKREWVKVTLQ